MYKLKDLEIVTVYNNYDVDYWRYGIEESTADLIFNLIISQEKFRVSRFHRETYILEKYSSVSANIHTTPFAPTDKRIDK